MLNALMNVRFWGRKRTLTNRCLPISIYEYTPKNDVRYWHLADIALHRCDVSNCIIRRHRCARRDTPGLTIITNAMATTVSIAVTVLTAGMACHTSLTAMVAGVDGCIAML